MLQFLRAILCALLMLGQAAPAVAQRELLPGILGADDRVPSESTEWPWTAIGRVNRATGGFCTGTLVGPRHVLTAAHCLFDTNGQRVHPSDLHFVAGYRRGEYLAHAVAAKVVFPDGYRPERKPSPEALAKDWGILVLRDPMPIRPIPVQAAADPAEAKLLRAGYSQDRAHLLSVHDDCSAVGSPESGRLIVHTCDATRGDSGSPLLLRTADGAAIVGINVGVGQALGLGFAVPAETFADALAAVLAE